MPMYRCTRPKQYASEDSPGHSDTSAREGYFVVALSDREAMQNMKSRFHNDEVIDVEEWNPSDTLRKIRLRAS